MDIALELVDKYLFDYIYSAVLPLKTPSQLLERGAANGTAWDVKAASSWHYEPASQFISFVPADVAYMSQWSRDNIYRQALTLLVVTWYFSTSMY